MFVLINVGRDQKRDLHVHATEEANSFKDSLVGLSIDLVLTQANGYHIKKCVLFFI